jgi:ketosteroid isomerase-like protein
MFLAPMVAATPASGSAESSLPTVEAAEVAFARSMADRNFEAFAAFVADDAVFLNGGQPLRGKPAVLAYWKKFFDGPAPPFSWRPDLAEVNLRGDLGTTTGPVSSPEGKVFARFYSMWRRETDGRWRIVFDNGYAWQEPAQAAQTKP